MTTIRINGKSNYVSSQEVTLATKWMIDHLLGSRLAKNLQIDVNIKRLRNMRGECTWSDSHHRPRSFTISVSSTLRYESFLTTLAHELIHVKQYVKGELKDYVKYPGACKWKSKRIHYDYDYYTHPTFPWEIEAYGYQSALYCKYLIAHNRGITE